MPATTDAPAAVDPLAEAEAAPPCDDELQLSVASTAALARPNSAIRIRNQDASSSIVHIAVLLVAASVVAVTPDRSPNQPHHWSRR